jgi:hypothetical protein
MMDVFFPVIHVNEFKPINGKTDVDVSKYTNKLIQIIVTELLTLQQLLSTVDNDTTDVGNFQRHVIGRLMKRLLNMIPVYVDDEPHKGMVTDTIHQIANLMQIIEQRKIDKKTHDLSLAQSNIEDDERSTLAIAKRIKKYITDKRKKKGPETDPKQNIRKKIMEELKSDDDE